MGRLNYLSEAVWKRQSWDLTPSSLTSEPAPKPCCATAGVCLIGSQMDKAHSHIFKWVEELLRIPGAPKLCCLEFESQR